MFQQNNNGYLKGMHAEIKLFSFRLFFSILMFVLFSLITTSSFASNLSLRDLNSRGSKSSNGPGFNETTGGSVWLLPSDGIYIEARQLKTDLRVKTRVATPWHAEVRTFVIPRRRKAC